MQPLRQGLAAHLVREEQGIDPATSLALTLSTAMTTASRQKVMRRFEDQIKTETSF